MNILITGGTGFVGQNLVPSLIQKGHNVTMLSRDKIKAKKFKWFNDTTFISMDLSDFDLKQIPNIEKIDALIHLAWSGLPNYKSLTHYEENLPVNYCFLKKILEAGVKHILVTGTCFEYGNQSGCLKEDFPTSPGNPYGLAKDTLRKFLELLQHHIPFTMQWARLFYMYGPGQNESSLISQLDKAIENGDKVFNMSGGEQLRDYLHVGEVTDRLERLLNNPSLSGVVNICRGAPISVRKLVEDYALSKGANISLNLGFYPYPDYEPMAFWGDTGKFNSIL